MSTHGIEMIHDYLQKLGLTDYQARVVSCLFIAPQMTAKELSDNTDIPYKKIYQVLDSLMERSIIHCNNTKPKLFDAEPQKTIVGLIEEKQKKIDLLKTSQSINLKIVEDMRNKWVRQMDSLLNRQNAEEGQWI